MNKKNVITLFALFWGLALKAQTTWQSAIIKLEKGKLVYTKDREGNSIPDFSYAGYKNSDANIPICNKVIKEVSPVEGDNTENLNNAIRSCAKIPKDSLGIRGVLVLKKGLYDVYGTVTVNIDGIIIRGEGSGKDPAFNTVIYGRMNEPANRSVMVAGSHVKKWQRKGAITDITTEVVQINELSFEVESTRGFKPGDAIVIEHPCSEKWLKAIDYGGTANDTAAKWKTGSLPIVFSRTIKRITGNKIFVDVPVYNRLDKNLSQSFIYKIDNDVREEIGIENFRIEILDWSGRDIDEKHAGTALHLIGVRDCWVKDISTANFINSGIALVNADRVSIVNSVAEDPVSLITGGRRYNFSVDGYCSQILFKDCVARRARHSFVSNGTTTVSGIVMLNCTAIDPYACAEGHRKWSMAMLFDNYRDKGDLPENRLVLGIYNRGSFGTGHGWSAVNSVIWNCDLRRDNGQAGILTCQKPPTAQNYVIGGQAVVNENTPFPQYAYGYVEGVNNTNTLLPQSLFNQQLLDRHNNQVK